jgi:hypothetical protein
LSRPRVASQGAFVPPPHDPTTIPMGRNPVRKPGRPPSSSLILTSSGWNAVRLGRDPDGPHTRIFIAGNQQHASSRRRRTQRAPPAPPPTACSRLSQGGEKHFELLKCEHINRAALPLAASPIYGDEQAERAAGLMTERAPAPLLGSLPRWTTWIRRVSLSVPSEGEVRPDRADGGWERVMRSHPSASEGQPRAGVPHRRASCVDG